MIAQRHATVGSVASLWRYPVKSMMGESLDFTYMTEQGVLGDRVYAVIDRTSGKVASAKNPRKWPTLFGFSASYVNAPEPSASIPPVVVATPDGKRIRSDSPAVDEILAGALDREVFLKCGAPDQPSLEEYWPDMDSLAHRDEVTDERMPSATFFDCASVHVLTTATLARLAELYPQGRFDVQRFRPNILIWTGPESSFVENTWIGRTVAIGPDVRLEITGATGRCVMTTLRQGELPRDLGILKTAVQHNRGHVGVYATVVRPGTARRADAVRVE
jgi:uncharacterized protein